MTSSFITEFFDSHNHLDFSCYTEKRGQLVETCCRRGIKKQLIAGVEPKNWVNQLKVCQEYQLYAAIGIHPLFIPQNYQQAIQQIPQLLQQPSVIAIGECGLDFWAKDHDATVQIDAFQLQISLAREQQLPLVLHCRKAWDQLTVQISRQDFTHGGIAHAFAGSQQQAFKLIDLGFKLGFGGAVTHPRANKLRKTLKALPDDAIVLETDAPDMRPAFIQSSENSPFYLPEIAAVIASLRNQALPQLAEHCWNNTHQALKLDQ